MTTHDLDVAIKMFNQAGDALRKIVKGWLDTEMLLGAMLEVTVDITITPGYVHVYYRIERKESEYLFYTNQLGHSCYTLEQMNPCKLMWIARALIRGTYKLVEEEYDVCKSH